MRNSIYQIISSKYVLFATILVCSFLSIIIGGVAYFLGLIVVLTLLWASKFNWNILGISKPNWKATIIKAIIYAFLIYFSVDIFIQPLIERYYGVIDSSSLDPIRGNFIPYLISILFMWVVAAFGEELVYRGYFIKQIALLLGNTDKAWKIAALISSISFGLAHSYQGITGLITTGLIGFILSLIFIKNRTNLILLMLIHGFYDMIGMTLIYFNCERVIIDWVIDFF